MNNRPNQPVLPERIGRYNILKLLGKGGQGVVMLARDDELGRPVAIKLLRPDASRVEDTLASEARIVSRLQHPNIVTLYDVGTYSSFPYLVFEYIEGESLLERIKQAGKLEFADTVMLMSQILAGVAYLHEHEIVHRDLSPANILLTADGIPKVTDFGISVLRQPGQAELEYAGTLRYMAPEPFLEQAPGPASDVFTLATIFYEMLSGQRLYDGTSSDEIINEIMNGPPVNMAEAGIDVPEKVAEVLMRATQRPLAARYADAREMKNHLDEYRLPRANESGPATAAQSTIDFLIRRMEFKSGFSSLSQHVSEILVITAEDSVAPASRLVNILVKDVTLTQRVLTFANSAYYGNTEITALPRALVLLGLDQVRMCVTSALLNSNFEAGSETLREALTRSFHSAVLAKAIAPAFGIRSRADAFTGALYHELGRFLVIHYFEEEFATIVERTAKFHSDEITQSRIVLGAPFHDLGAGIAAHWKFSSAIVDAMRPMPRGAIAALPDDENRRLQICCAYANAVSRAISEHEDPAHRDLALADAATKVAAAMSLSPTDLDTALAEAAQLSAPYAKLNNLDPTTNASIARLLDFEALAGAA